MPRTRKTLTLVCLSEFARDIGRELATVNTWIRRGQHGFPKPFGVSSAGPVWLPSDVGEWKARHADLCR